MMKLRTVWKILSCSVLFAVLLLLLVSCNTGNPSETGGESAFGTTEHITDAATTEEIAETEAPYEITLSAAYKIVYPEDTTETVFKAASGLVTSIFAKTGAFCDMGSDLVLDIPGYGKSEYEILIGECDRDVTRKVAATMRSEDTVIAVVDHQIVILGGTDALTASAVTYFAETILASGNVLSSGELYRQNGTYKMDTLTLNGTDIRNFRIVYQQGTNSPYRAVANVLRDMIRDYCGYSLTVADSSAEETPYEFLIGECGRASVGTVETETSFSVAMLAKKTEDGCKIAFDAENEYSIERALGIWFSQYFDPSLTGNASLSVEYAWKEEAVNPGLPLTEGATMRVMSNNILSAEGIEERAPLLVDIYLEYFPDIIGFQEFPTEAHELIYGNLSKYYGIADTTIGDTSKLSRTPIFYRKDLYTVVAAETFFYDSRWPKTNTKTLAWAVLEVKATGERFAVMNTHYAIVSDSYDTLGYYGKKYTNDVEGVQWRNDNSRQVLETLAMLRKNYGEDISVLFMGDLNCNVESEALRKVGEELDNAINCATVSKSTGTASSHTLGEAPSASKLPIDHIYVTSASVDVYTHLILKNSKAVLDSSDHCPVICEIALK